MQSSMRLHHCDARRMQSSQACTVWQHHCDAFTEGITVKPRLIKEARVWLYVWRR